MQRLRRPVLFNMWFKRIPRIKKFGHSVPQCIKVFHSVGFSKTSHGNV